MRCRQYPEGTGSPARVRRVSHGVLGDMARERISGSCIERVLTSDTVPMAYGPKVDCVSVGDLLGHAVQRIHDGESVSSII